MTEYGRKERRAPLLALMEQLKDKETGCRDCSGVCCTFVGNSMQITVLEAYDLYQYLRKEGRWTQALGQKMKETIEQFRLDVPVPSDGRRSFARRRYTCPFFKEKSLGCSIDPGYKPYGCLGFNALSCGVKDGENCGSYTQVLEERELAFGEESRQQEDLKAELGLDWDKTSIPQAVLDLAERLPFDGSQLASD